VPFSSATAGYCPQRLDDGNFCSVELKEEDLDYVFNRSQLLA
jgi:hypothetical protein